MVGHAGGTTRASQGADGVGAKIGQTLRAGEGNRDQTWAARLTARIRKVGSGRGARLASLVLILNMDIIWHEAARPRFLPVSHHR